MTQTLRDIAFIFGPPESVSDNNRYDELLDISKNNSKTFSEVYKDYLQHSIEDNKVLEMVFKEVIGKEIIFNEYFFGQMISSTNNNQNNNHNNRVSPTSVVSGQHLLPSSSSSMNSWGLLAVQNAVEDECLLDDCGGYRELDLTIIRNKPPSSRNIVGRNTNSNSNKLRWVISDIDWTGGNMMRLTTDPYSGLATLPMDENGMAFDPKTLLEGDKAIQFASKYFPSLVKRLQIQNLMNEEGTGASSSTTDDAMVIIGDMTIVASQSFVHPQHVTIAGADADEDGLWND